MGGKAKRRPSRTLEEYRRKRDFERTPEPAGSEAPVPGPAPRRFVIHKHHARTLHYDLRLESGGVLRSWAVPKGPSLDPSQRRLAVEVEDHPIGYGSFEGVIPEGEYGAGRVIVWDHGTFAEAGGEETFEELLAGGTARVTLGGEKLKGRFALIRTAMGGSRKNWLLVKEKDGEARSGSDITAEKPLSVLTGLDVEEVGRKG